MLAAFAAPSSGERLRGDLFALPFATGSFDAVVCCRLLHHLREPEELRRALAELVRASAELVVASFWDAGSLPALRRRVVPGARPPRRHAHPRVLVTTLLAELGADVLEFRADLRFFTRQTFFVACKRRESD
jgi:SAM-dependent methyltransferase